MKNPRTPIFYFEDFEADARARELYRRGTRIKVYGQPFEILIALLEHPGEVLTREELRVRLWPTNTFVDFERVLNTSVMRLRNALGDSAANPRFIETLPRVGYRFIAPVIAEEKECVSRIAVPQEASGVASNTTVSPTEAAVIENGDDRRVVAVDRDQERAPVLEPAVEYVNSRRLIHAALVGATVMIGIVFAGSFFGQVKKWEALRASLGNATLTGQVSSRPVIAILSFANLSGRPEEDWLSSAFAEMLATEMGAGETLRVVPTHSLKAPHSPADNDQFAQELLQRVRTDQGAKEVVLGSYTPLGKESGGLVRVDIHVRDTSSGEVRAELSATGTEAKLFPMVAQLGAQLRNKLGVRAVADDNAGLSSGLAGNFKVVRLSSR
jgi:DNA-binding winged helix-turn-helix (wHTH) protein/TolB-like protein